MLGRARDDLSAGLRVLSLDRRFTIAYRIEPRQVLIAMVFVRGQDFEAAMRGPQPD